ncbi:MAG: hypothetical protein ACLP7W_05160, partial [Solirubrobacteraceae bacterium]
MTTLSRRQLEPVAARGSRAAAGERLIHTQLGGIFHRCARSVRPGVVVAASRGSASVSEHSERPECSEGGNSTAP